MTQNGQLTISPIADRLKQASSSHRVKRSTEFFLVERLTALFTIPSNWSKTGN